MRITVVGAGGWGTTLANMLSEKNEVSLWIREKELLDIMKKDRVNTWFLPSIKLSDKLLLANDYSLAKGADMIIFAVPSQFMRHTARDFAPYIGKNSIIVSVAKGIEQSTYKRMSQVLGEELGKAEIVALSGPNHCEEVARKIPTATTIASEDQEMLQKIKPSLETAYFKVYPHDDIIGVEICGAIKNITAIASGVVDGLGFGDNAKGAIITYGLTEMNKFGRFFGAKRKTIYGLAGVGDLIATCTSKHSRNRFVGRRIAQGKKFEEIKEDMHGMIAEGITTAKSVYEFSKKNDIEMLLTSQVYKVLFEKKDLEKAIKDLIKLI